MKPRTSIGLAILASVILIGCATFETNAYRTIGTTSATVDTLMTTWADESVSGRTTPALDFKVTSAYTNYQHSMALARIAIDGYRGGSNTQDRVTATLIQLAGNKELLRQLILSLVLPPAKQTAIHKLP